MILLIALSLSMDAFSLALAYGTNKIANKIKYTLSIIVGLFHFIMPIIGYFIGTIIMQIIKIKPNIIVSIILIFIGISMCITKKEKLDSLKSIKEEFETLSEGVDSAGNNVDLSTDKYARYNEIRNQLAESFPEIVSGYDEEGNAILKAGTNIDNLIKQEQEAIDTTKALYATISNLKDATTAAKEEVVVNDNNRIGDKYE